MNEPLAVEPQPARADDSGRATPAGFGYALAQARVRAGLTVEQAAARIRLQPRQLQAIENEDLQSLPAAAYVNGFVRNYARELGIDAGPLIEDLNAKLTLRGLSTQEPDLSAGSTAHAPLLDERTWRNLVLAAIVIGLICAGLLGLWMARSAYRSERGAAPAPTRSEAPPAPGVAPAEAGTAMPPPSAPEATGGTGQQPQAVAPGPLPGGPATPSDSDSGQAPSAAVAAPTAGGGAATTAGAALAAAPTAPAASATDAEGKAALAVGTRMPVSAATPAAGTTTGLLLRFTERSWVEVSQPDGRVLLSHIGEPGSLELVNATAPLVLVVGRADAVKVEYRGQPVNLKPYVNTTNGVARVLLADEQR
jgi:cytoskeleton protein RodZ